MSRGSITSSFSGGEAEDFSFEDLQRQSGNVYADDQDPLETSDESFDAGCATGTLSEHAASHPDVARSASLAKRNSSPVLRSEASVAESAGRFAASEVNQPRGSLRKTSSIMRLCMGSDGKASIVTKDTTSPSPPRPAQTAGEQSLSVAGLGIPSPSAPAIAPLKRSSSGRSRDSRAWEFWCDKDARTELEEKAEKDTQGSAADAIGLLRSSLGRRVLGPISTKRNALLTRQSATAKRTKLDISIPSLAKSSTSQGRLEHGGQKGERLSIKPSLPGHKSGTSINIPGNESDKENWSPGSEWQCNDHSKRRHADKDAHDADSEVDAFMRGGRRSSNVSGEEEMDCVQGLLSLSQGNWK
jgi:hypothetical protein